MKRLKRALLITVALLVALSVAVFVYAEDYYRADETAVAAAASADASGNLTVFHGGEIGFIFYPGGKVEDISYAPLMVRLQSMGITSVIVRMPLNLAVLDMNAWEEAKAAAPNVKRWFIGGHSLGGAMAAAAPADEFAGLVLLAAYPTKEVNMPVLSIVGTKDGVLNREKYNRALSLMPRFTEKIIEGGNHAGFGSYGSQEGDNPADITGEKQTNLVADAIINFIEEN